MSGNQIRHGEVTKDEEMFKGPDNPPVLLRPLLAFAAILLAFATDHASASAVYWAQDCDGDGQAETTFVDQGINGRTESIFLRSDARNVVPDEGWFDNNRDGFFELYLQFGTGIPVGMIDTDGDRLFDKRWADRNDDMLPDFTLEVESMAGPSPYIDPPNCPNKTSPLR